MSDVLARICADKRAHVARRKRERPLSDLDRAARAAGATRGFAARLLGPVRAYDQRNGAALLPTLAAFLAADGSWTRCAAALHLHVNTVRYRIGCVERLTGRDLSRLEDRVDFFLALRLA